MMTLKMPKRLKAQSPAHAHAKVQEKRAAKLIRGRVTPGSGNQYQKGDARKRGVVRIECKSTKHRSYPVSMLVLEKLDEAVFGSGEIPVLQVDLLSKDGRRVDGTFYVVTKIAMESMLERLTHEPD